MIWNLKRVQQMSSQQIYDALLPTIKEIYSSFQYLNLTEEEYEKLVLNEISLSKTTYQENLDYTDFIKKKIKVLLSEKVKHMFLNSKAAFTIINHYCMQKFTHIIDYKDALNYFKKLNLFLETYQYEVSPDLLIELINKNTQVSKMIELIFTEYQEQILAGKSEEIDRNNLVIFMIDAYCMLKNIEVSEPNIDEMEYEFDDVSTIDIVHTYLKEIGKKPLLTVEQERELALQMEKGNQEARELFIESNLRLVVNIAKKYVGRGLLFMDLIQEGNLGLMKAVDRFDIRKGYKFSTYAVHWIRQAITRAIADKGRNIRLPVHMYNKIKTYEATVIKLEKQFGRSPTIDEIANEMGLNKSSVMKLQKLQVDTVSINTFVGDEEDSELGDFVPSSEETPEEKAITHSLSSQVRSLLEKCNLTPREMDVILLRNGFYGGEPKTLEAIGKKYNLTRERIRQIEAKAYVKLRQSKYIKALADYMEHPEDSIQNIEDYREHYREAKYPYRANLVHNSKKLKTVREREEMSKLQSIYEYFHDYTKEQIDEMLTKLTEEERELVYFRYGEDLEHPITTKLTKEQQMKFYNILVPKMRKLLANPTGQRKPRKKKVQIEEPVVPTTSTKTIESTTSTSAAMVKEDYVKILAMLRTPSFAQMVETLSVKEAVILSLKLGYIDGKYFSTESIANFLGIESREVIETTKNVLTVYKEYINGFLDNAISVVTNEEKPTR